MKVSVNWLQDYISPKLTTQELAEALEQAGVEVEGIEYAPQLDPKIVIAKVVSVRKHPGADRLRLVKIDTGKTKLDIVCGAPNVAAKQTVVLAQVGAALPDGTVITKAEIRGQVSEGMICSAKELRMGDDHSGIMVLADGLPLGQTAAKHISPGDILDLKTAANRSDLVGLVGLAREAMAIYGGKLKLPETADLKLHSDERVAVASNNASRYLLVEIKISPGQSSPAWLIGHLNAAGIRPVNLVVDVTNFVMLEWGQPLHAYDGAKVKLPISVRQADKVDKITTLDGAKRTLSKNDLVIADARGPIALAGVMGGQKTEVTLKTTRIYLESATFNGASIRKSAVRHNLRTEASARFERQLPVQVAAVALARAVELLQRLGGAKVVGHVTDQLTVWPWVQQIGIRVDKFNNLTGLKLKPQAAITKLESLGFMAEAFDITTEVKKHLGKPFISGASFKSHGESAFDCSYLTERVYSRIGIAIGHTAHQQYKSGQSVELSDLRPGDLVFRGGPWVLHDKKEREGVSHDAMYIGDGQIINTRDYMRDERGQWVQLPATDSKVVIEPLLAMTKDPEYLGAKRYAENLDGWVAVTVPWWRPDVKLFEDLAEELVRQVGYDQIPATLPVWHPTNFDADSYYQKLWRLKSILKALGLFEVNTYSFVSSQDIANLGYLVGSHLMLQNPKSNDQAYMRRNLLPSLLASAKSNRHFGKQFGMYEISKVFWPAGRGKLPAEPLRLGILTFAPANAYHQLKVILDTISQNLGGQLVVSEANYPELIGGRAVKITTNGLTLGTAGEVKPAILAKYKLSGSVGYLDIDLSGLFGNLAITKHHVESKFPPIRRDLSFEVKQNVTWAVVAETLNAFSPQFLSDFAGVGVAPNHKKVAVRFEFSASDRTLTETEADQQLTRVKKLLNTKFGVQIS